MAKRKTGKTTSRTQLSPAEIKRLIHAAAEVRKNAYAPYSRYRVGAAILGLSGKIYPGCNVENASLGLTVCAERAAVFRACAEKDLKFRAIAVVTGGKTPGLPCGACLQVLTEFAPRLEVFAAKGDGTFKRYRLDELLPEAFQL